MPNRPPARVASFVYTARVDVDYELFGERFVWDEDKALSNQRKHGISFEKAAEVFVDPLVNFLDADVTEENREAAVGRTRSQTILYVVHIDRADGRIRIISARDANARERRDYENRS